ncbi:Erythronolide synthase, modules 1 and 2 [Metarhizium anisopliae BRIP 53284]|nr:Erythronolide synthase, modules 1 and 2 [Metarhizium anisopliae BRIP 53284]
MSGISDHDYQVLVNEFNATEDISLLGSRLDQLFEQVADRFPDNTAVIHNEHEVTFKQLNSSANILARCLAKRGLQQGDVVGLAVSRSIDLIASILAVLKLGAAYVPIDPSFPAERINQMVEDAGLRLILLSGRPTKGLGRWASLCLNVSEARDGSVTDGTNLETEIHTRDLAYVIYTSGSTGRPKGVEISHGAAANFLSSLRKHEPGCSERDRLLAITTISFDMSALELLLPLVSGSAMIIANTSAVKDPRELISLMARHKVTILQATPATWTMLLEVGQGDIVVGNPVANGRIYVLDDNMSPVPIGSEGEVYIGGGSVSNGYRNKAELTRSRFLVNPFHGGVFFRTGDLARFIAPGKLQVVGRIDGVVKIRGHRIDVGDIEAVLVDHANVSEAVVVSRDDRLVAYCVLHAPCHDAASLDGILRPWVAERLPAYMLPTFFVQMDALPLSPSEKVNRKALPDPIEAMQHQTMIQPTSELEQRIQAIWSDILGHDRFGTEDNFFRIGGDSVRIIRMQAALEKQLHRPVPTPKLFEHYTIKALAAYLAGTGREHNNESQAVSQTFAGSHEDIAIVSMACRLPGGVATPEALWQLLQSRGDTIIDVPKDRWDADKLYNADANIDGTSYCRRGGFLDAIYSYDASFFGISPREAQAMDPTHNLMLELCWEGFERAGYTRDQLSGSATGVFLGVSNNATTNGTPPDLKGYSITGSASATMCGRLSYTLGLRGPSLVVDTACSSSLVATYLACNALRQGECSMALAGGVSLLTTPGIHIEFSKLGGLSADGRCRAFSDDTDGTGFSEGAAIIVLKRLSDARRDGDDIHAVLRGSAVMHGGSSAGLTAPSGPGQVALLRNALARAALEPGDIDYVEAHGTATKLGDPIEATALAEVFGTERSGSEPLRIGSAKSNLGHTQAAAGVVGLLKVVLSMKHDTLPRTLHVREPMAAVDWKGANMELVLQNRPWLPNNNRLRRAGVSAFGIGGTNAHVIVEESPPPAVEEPGNITLPSLPATLPFVLSGQGDSALRAQAEKLRLHIESGAGKDSRLSDVAYSLATCRSHLHRRLVVMAGDKADTLEKLASVSSGPTQPLSVNDVGSPTVAMLFTGQGSQLPGMGKDLYALYPVFRDALDEIAAKFTDLERPLLDIMWAESGSENAALLSRTDFAQPALFALEVSLWKLWQSWGVKPDFVLGHSVGELAAAHAAGVLDLSDACRLVMMRGRLMQAIPRQGKMASVEASSAEVSAAIQELGQHDKVEIAGYNAPSQMVISGDAEAVEAILEHIQSLGRKTKLLDTSHAFHSFHMDGMLDDLRALAQNIRFSPPKMRIISSMTGRLAKAGELERAEYWVQQARNAVRFSDAFQTMAGQGANVFLELGPRAMLCGLGAACLADPGQVDAALWLPSLKPNVDGPSVIQSSLGKLHVRHVPVDWAAYFKPFGCKRVMLPTYAFQREDFRPTNKASWFDVVSPSSGTNDAAPRVQDMMFEINWRRVETKSIQPCGAWGLLYPSGETAWTTEAQMALSATGIQLVAVSKPHEADQLDGLLSLWDSDADTVHMAHGVTALALAQLQEAIRTGFGAPIVWVTRHAVGAGADDRPVNIGAGPLWGLMRAARSEHPELRLRLIDVDEETDCASLSQALMLTDQTEIAARREQLLMPHMERAGPAAPLPVGQPFVRTDGAVLVTGGLGDLGSRVARRLATAHGVCDLILVSRQGASSPGADALVAELAELGAKATIVGCDLADLDSLGSVMQLFTPDRPLRGVVHAAGVVDSGTLSSLTARKCAAVFAPKVDGLWNLHQLTKHMDLDLFMMFSSISGIIGLPGLGNYAAANSFIDSLAHLRRAQGLPASSVAYGTWAGDGMATTLVPTTRAHLAQLGQGFLPPEAGLEIFEQAVYQGRALTVAAVLDLQRLRAYYEEQGGVPPLLHSMLGGTKVHKPADEVVSLRDLLAEAAPEKYGSIVLHMVQETIAKALGYTRAEDVDASRPMQELGIDSLTAILTRNHLATLTGIALPPNIALLYPNLKSLSEFLLCRLLDDVEGSTSSPSDTDGATPSTPTSAASCVDMADIRRGILDSTFQFNNPVSPGVPETVFVTGATGFVGAFMIHEFLQRRISVYCLVVFDDLASRVDAILHSGALVDWMRPLDDYIGPNVLGTHEVLRLASCGRAKAIHFISTISTLPIHAGYGLAEHDGEYGYGTSKYLAEKMVVAARFRGATASSYRLPFVAASAASGRFRLDRGDFLNNLVTGSLDLGAFPLINADLSSVLPVDYLCGTIAAIMTEDQERVGEDYDFVNPQALTFKDFFEMMCDVSGGKEMVSFGEWHRRALEYAAAHPTSSLARIATVLDGYNDKTVGSLVSGSPVGKHVLGLDAYRAPPLDEEYVRRYVHCIEAARAKVRS